MLCAALLAATTLAEHCAAAMFFASLGSSIGAVDASLAELADCLAAPDATPLSLLLPSGDEDEEEADADEGALASERFWLTLPEEVAPLGVVFLSDARFEHEASADAITGKE